MRPSIADTAKIAKRQYGIWEGPRWNEHGLQRRGNGNDLQRLGDMLRHVTLRVIDDDVGPQVLSDFPHILELGTHEPLEGTHRLELAGHGAQRGLHLLRLDDLAEID